MIKLKVREVAEQRGVNKSQLSRRADLGMTTINQIWDGTRDDVRISTLAAIAKALNVRVVDLIEETDGQENAGGNRAASGTVKARTGLGTYAPHYRPGAAL